MAENENNETNDIQDFEYDGVEIASGFQIKANGPTARGNGAEILRLYREDKRRKTLDIRSGQILTVGEDITDQEADQLLNLSFWNFERVDE